MFDKELRKTIGARTRARRKELKLTQEYLADKLDVNKSTIQRYESGSIDNTKRLIVEGLANALYVSPEWLRGETNDMKTKVNNKVSLELLEEIDRVKERFPLKLDETGNDFAQCLLLILVKEFMHFAESFEMAHKTYTKPSQFDAFAGVLGLESGDEFTRVMYMREIMHTSNTLTELSALITDYVDNPENTLERIKNLMKFYL